MTKFEWYQAWRSVRWRRATGLAMAPSPFEPGRTEAVLAARHRLIRRDQVWSNLRLQWRQGPKVKLP